MKPYEKMERTCRFGHYNEEKMAGYTITDPRQVPSPWYYIYQNRKVLLYVDQNGPVKLQYEPPYGILLFKRELGETESKMQTWIKTSVVNNGIPISNFASPKLSINGEEPKATVNYSASCATYKYEYKNIDVINKLFVPFDKATVCIKTTIKNKTDKEINVKVSPSVFPYINIPQMVAWDLPEWYLSVKPRLNGRAMTFAGKMNSPDMIAENERSVTYNVDFDENGEFTLDMAEHTGTGNFFAPKSVIDSKKLSYKMIDAERVSGFGGLPSVFSVRYNVNIPTNGSKTFTQVLTVQDDRNFNSEENGYDNIYFNEESYKNKIKETENFFNDLFSKKRIRTGNALYNKFINEFAPLEMYWVCSLDRGWPSSMRGTRDASQDFIGLVDLYPEWVRKNIKQIFSRQKSNGWFPRQFNIKNKCGPHDLRYFCDGGAFLLELLNEYFTYTRDFDFLFDKEEWLDSDNTNTILEHIEKTFDFYLDSENIGEHYLCKVWYGDWWDPMDKIGTDGIGESVTVTAQTVLNLKNFARLFRFLVERGVLEKKYSDKANLFLAEREKFINGMRKYAFNAKGYFNGYYNDNRKWILSDKDPDGESRIYLVSNAWAIISGCADEKMIESVIDNVCKYSYNEKYGYYTNSKGFPIKIDKAGRKGNGTQPNPATYNHAESFWVRACTIAGKPDLSYETTKYILPIDSEKVPYEMTFAPPYAIANSYSCKESTPHRVGLQFLSGTVSYVLRTVYNFFFGITYEFDGLTIKPNMPSDFGDCSATFKYLDKNFTLKYRKTSPEKIIVMFNGKELRETRFCEENGREYPFIADYRMEKDNKIEIEY